MTAGWAGIEVATVETPGLTTASGFTVMVSLAGASDVV